MNAAAVQTTTDAPLARRVAHNVDLAVLVLALPVFVAGGLPLLGWGVVAAAWLAQRGIQAILARKALGTDPRRGTALLAMGTFARMWLLAGAIFAGGMVDREAGLSAAVLAVVLVTAYLTAAITRRSFELPGAGGTRTGTP
ncbi:MAG TPA: hypothetical protein VF520_04290 [Thermoleophilaceae bacterium]|jgi:hypothetical protein